MNRLRRFAPVALMSLALAGCAAVTSVSMKMDKEIALDDVKSLAVGTPESAVIARLGRPLFFGVDKDGLEYLHYESATITNSEAGLPTPFVGASSSALKMKGWGAGIYLQDGVVKKIEYTVYRDAAPDKR